MATCNNLKKILLILLIAVLGVISSGVMAATTYTATVNGTSYNLTTFTGTYNANSAEFSATLMPWWSNDGGTLAGAFAAAFAGNLGSQTISSANYGPLFAYAVPSNVSSKRYVFSNSSVGSNSPAVTASRMYAILYVPEIDGALIPQVGFLIGCLFLILGRRHKNTEPILAV